MSNSSHILSLIRVLFSHEIKN